MKELLDLRISEINLYLNPTTHLANTASKEKVQLFMSLFKGRSDVCAKRGKNQSGYSPYCFNDFKPGICHKPKVKCTECKHSNFAFLDEERIENHLLGKYILGLYPMTLDDTCFLLAMDFDESTWKKGIKTVIGICDEKNIAVYPERSQSGNTCHLWFFFDEETKASVARKFGTIILNLSMEECGDIRFNSYDRLFPSQDFLQKDGFGNLIALPLQKQAREQSNSVFVDKDIREIEDQWHYFLQIQKISGEDILRICTTHRDINTDDNSEVLKVDKEAINITKLDFPEIVVLERCRGIKVSKNGLSPKALLLLRKLASYANAEFYAKQTMRLSTYGAPRVTVVYDEYNDSIILPRGVETKLINILDENNIRYSINDTRYEGKDLNIGFIGQLRDRQEDAFRELNQYNEGVLSATTGFGKTVIGARIIAEKVENRKKNKSIIGQLGGEKKELFGIVDIAIMQSMCEKDKSVKQIGNGYGLIIIDECHHISATNFSRIISFANAKHIYALWTYQA